MTAVWIALAVAAQLGSFAFLAHAQRQLLAAGGVRPSLPAMLGLAFEANAINATLPGGTALAAGYSLRRLRSWGASGASATFTVLASGLLSALAFSGLVTAWAITSGGQAGWAALAAALPAAAVAGGLLCRPHWLALLVGRLGARSIAARIARFAEKLRAVRPGARQWCSGFAHTGLNWLADLACLAACCTAMQAGDVRPGLLFGAYLAGMAAANASLLPAGLGTTEATMIATLGAGGVGATTAAGTVACYRIISVGAVVALGWVLCGRRWWQRRATRRPATFVPEAAVLRH